MTSTPTSALPKSTDEVPKFKVVILGKQQQKKPQQNGILSLAGFVYHSSIGSGFFFLSIPCCVYLYRSYWYSSLTHHNDTFLLPPPLFLTSNYV